MTAPTTDSYRTLLANQLRPYEGVKRYIYRDSDGFLTTAMGLLLINRANRPQADAFASVRSVLNEGDKSLFDNIDAALRRAGNVKAELAKDFVIDDKGVLTHFRNGSASEDRSTWADIRTLIPTDAAAVKASASMLAEKERFVDGFLKAMHGKPGYENFELTARNNRGQTTVFCYHAAIHSVRSHHAAPCTPCHPRYSLAHHPARQ